MKPSIVFILALTGSTLASVSRQVSTVRLSPVVSNPSSNILIEPPGVLIRLAPDHSSPRALPHLIIYRKLGSNC